MGKNYMERLGKVMEAIVRRGDFELSNHRSVQFGDKFIGYYYADPTYFVIN